MKIGNYDFTNARSTIRISSRREGDVDRFAPLRHLSLPFARLSLFVVYFWFGALKVAGMSPAGPLVSALWLKTIPFVPLDKFMILFACFEMLIGILFLIPRLEGVAIPL